MVYRSVQIIHNIKIFYNKSGLYYVLHALNMSYFFWHVLNKMSYFFFMLMFTYLTPDQQFKDTRYVHEFETSMCILQG